MITPESALLTQLRKMEAGTTPLKSLKDTELMVAYSGGLDSSVLLHASVQLLNAGKIAKLSVLHVNHGISPDADEWQKHCQQTCDNYKISLLSTKFELAQRWTTSEADAREARYSFFEQCVNDQQVLLFAHHQDDQAETVLFRLFRGSGIHGVSGMPRVRRFSSGYLLRPFLEFTKSELESFAKLDQLSWVEDDSNASSRYSRNYIRNEILPLLKNKWPEVTPSISRFAKIANDQMEILDETAQQDLVQVQIDKNRLDIAKLHELSFARQNNLLHFWIRAYGENSPSSLDIEQILNQISVVGSQQENINDQKIEIKVAGVWLRCFDGKLFMLKRDEPQVLTERLLWQDIGRNFRINKDIVLVVTSASSLESANKNLCLRLPTSQEIVTVRARTGGEKAKPSYRNHSTNLKTIYQELKIPSWQREWLPLIYFNEKLVAVPGVFVDQSVVDEKGIELSIRLAER